jgi:hypothetical protein
MTRRIWVIASLVVVGVVAGSLTAVYAFAGGGSGSGLASSESSVSPQISDSKCALKTMDVAVHGDSLNTTSTTFVSVPGAGVTFSQTGRAADCILVNFSSMSFASAGGTALLYVRAVLDGSRVLEPSSTQFSGDDDEDGDVRWSRTHDAQFVIDAVAPGTHTVDIQFRSLDGGSVTLHRGVTSVYHR